MVVAELWKVEGEKSDSRETHWEARKRDHLKKEERKESQGLP